MSDVTIPHHWQQQQQQQQPGALLSLRLYFNMLKVKGDKYYERTTNGRAAIEKYTLQYISLHTEQHAHIAD